MRQPRDVPARELADKRRRLLEFASPNVHKHSQTRPTDMARGRRRRGADDRRIGSCGRRAVHELTHGLQPGERASVWSST